MLRSHPSQLPIHPTILTAGKDQIAHQRHLEQHAVRRVQRRLPALVGVYLAETLVRIPLVNSSWICPRTV